MATIEKLTKVAEKNGWSVDFDAKMYSCFGGTQRKGGMSLQIFSPEGQDFNVELEGDTADELKNSLVNYYFDPDEEASLWIGEDGHGKNGAPYRLRDLLNDMEWCGRKIKSLAKAWNKVN